MGARSKGVVVQISAEENTGRAFSAVNEQISALKAQISSLRSQLSTMGDVGERAGHGMGASMTYASSAIREFEGNLPIRAVERFMTETLGLGPALAAAFPVVGALAFAGVLVKDVAELAKMREAVRLLAGEIQTAFDAAIAKERQHADELAVSNDRLEETIAKLEHKPAGNGLAAGLHEATAEADKLQGSIHAAASEAKALFDEKYKVSFLGRVTGTKSTDDVKDEVLAAMNQADEIQSQYGDVVQQARDAGNSKEHIDELNQMMLGHVQGVYSALDAKLKDQLKAALDAQTDDKHLGGTGADYQPLINSLQGSLGLSRQQQRTLGEQYRQSQLAPIASQDRGDEAPKGKKDDQQKMLDAQHAFADALRKQQEQAAASLAAASKLEADTELSTLEDKHRRGLVSEADYYAQRAALQEKALDAEIAANYQKQGALRDEILQRIGDRAKDAGNPEKLTRDDAAIIGLQTQLSALDEKRLDLTAKRGKIATEAATQEYLTLVKAADEAQRVAEQLETRRGGSTNARIQGVRGKFDDWKRANPNASPDAIADRQDALAMDEGQIRANGAQQDAGPALAGLGAQRSAIEHAAATGIMSQNEAQQARIRLDQQEAQALEPVLRAYESLAAAGDIAAQEKVAELQEKIAELKTPVNEVAAQIRSELNGALEQLFENLGKGKHAFSDFLNSIQAMALKETYQDFLGPLVQGGLGRLVPNRSGFGTGFGQGDQAGGGGGSLLSSLIPGLSRMPGVSPRATGGGQPIVQIINQTSSPASGKATQTGQDDGSAFTEMLRPKVLQIMLEDLDRGGSFAQALGSGLGGLNA